MPDRASRRPGNGPAIRLPRLTLAILLALATLLGALPVAPTLAADCQVTNGNDSGDGSLRAALARTGNFAGQGCETISFAAAVTTIGVASHLTIDRAVAINGPGMDALTIRHTGASASATGSVVLITGGRVTITGVTIADGKLSGGSGGGIRIAPPTGLPAAGVALYGVRLRDNTATDTGGGLYASNVTMTIVDSAIEGNRARPTGNTVGGGGGIHIDDELGSVAATLTVTAVVGNDAGFGGGILAGDIDATNGRTVALIVEGRSVVGTVARPNRAQFGGGIYAEGTALTVTDSTVDGNFASSSGGGIYTTGGALTVTGSTLSGNTGGFGGGLLVTNSTATIARSTLSGNSAFSINVLGTGGGIYVGRGGTLTMTGSTLDGNSAPGGGGGIYVLEGTATLVNSTLSGNRATGNVGGSAAAIAVGGIVANEGAATLRFVTVTGNTVRGAGTGGIRSVGSGTLTVVGSVVVGNSNTGGAASDCGPGVASQGGNLWGDANPCPDNAAGGDRNLAALGLAPAAALNPTLAANGGPTRTHALVPGGPAIDAAAVAPCATAPPAGAGGIDQRGIARPQGAACDAGAYEYQATGSSPTPSPSPSASPSPSPGPEIVFVDVPPGYWAHDQIYTFARRGITTGCDTDAQGQRYYCPERGVTRAEMAAFITRTLGQDQTPPPATATFADVPTDYWAFRQIEAFLKLGITTGCGTDEQGRLLFCPDRGVTRAEMAAFMVRAKGQTELRPADGTFADVPRDYWAYGWIERFLALDITTGCGEDERGRTYCPERGVTRAEMAVFIIRAYP